MFTQYKYAIKCNAMQEKDLTSNNIVERAKQYQEQIDVFVKYIGPTNV